MAVLEEAGAGGEDGEGHEPGGNAGELPADGEHTEECRQRRDDGRDRGVTIRGTASRQGGQRDAPEVQWRLIEVGNLPHPGGQPESVAKRVLREQHHACLILEPDGTAAHRRGIDHRRRAQHDHEQHPLTSRQPMLRFQSTLDYLCPSPRLAATSRARLRQRARALVGTREGAGHGGHVRIEPKYPQAGKAERIPSRHWLGRESRSRPVASRRVRKRCDTPPSHRD